MYFSITFEIKLLNANSNDAPLYLSSFIGKDCIRVLNISKI